MLTRWQIYLEYNPGVVEITHMTAGVAILSC